MGTIETGVPFLTIQDCKRAASTPAMSTRAILIRHDHAGHSTASSDPADQPRKARRGPCYRRAGIFLLAAAFVLWVGQANGPRAEGRDVAGAFAEIDALLREFGTIADFAINVHGERTTRRHSLQIGAEPCRWIVVTDAEVSPRRASPPRYRYTMTIHLNTLDPNRIRALPLAAWPWCCRRSADVTFETSDGRQHILTRQGGSWSVSSRGRLYFSETDAARRAARALERAVRACRRPGV